MSRRIGLGLIALWLLLSLPFNVAILKQLIRTAYALFAGLYAGLDRWIPAQYGVATVFVLWVIVFLLWPARIGRTLTVVLLAGSCCAIAGQLLLDTIYALRGYLCYPVPLGWAIFGAILVLNLVCLRALAVRG
ncbi:MAG: hypothetical protein LV481_06515 [Methylacidiphilales bacterium]|nr:hypothetical protein [Candidatus Methylacidiphilales bacterium]